MVRAAADAGAPRLGCSACGLDAAAEPSPFRRGVDLGSPPPPTGRSGDSSRCPALEDAAFAQRLHAHGIPILRAADVRVRTSARLDGRAARGLSVDLAVSAWRERRRFRPSEFGARQLAAETGATGP